jgi:integrase
MRRPKYDSDLGRAEARRERGRARVLAAAEPLGPVVAKTADRFIDAYPNPRTMSTYATGLLRLFGWCVATSTPILTMRRSDARLFAATISDVAPTTAESYLTAARAFFGFAVDEEVAGRNPFNRGPGSRKPAPEPRTPTPALTEEEFRDVLRPLRRRIEAGTATVVEERDYALLAMGGRLGQRSISMRTLTWGDWVATRGRTEGSFYIKANRRLKLPVPADVAALVERWHGVLEAAIGRPLRPADHVFPGVGSDAEIARIGEETLPSMTGEALSGIATRRFRDAGLEGPRLSFHALRATMTTIGHEHGATNEELQTAGGWRDPKMPDVYTRRYRADQRRAADRWSLEDDGAA